MKKILSISIIGLFFLSGFGAGVISEASITTTVQWTVMYYLNGDNLISAAQGDHLNDLQTVGSNNQVNVAVLIDQAENGDTCLYYLDGNDLVKQDWPSESNMAVATTISDFVNKAKTDLSADHYYLHLSSNRGSGWQGISWDETDGEGIMISYPDLLDALLSLTDNGADKLDIIGIETCTGGMTEDAYQLRSVADYLVSYEDCGLAGPKQYAFPYGDSLAELVGNPGRSPEEFVSVIPDFFTPLFVPQLKLKTVLTATDLGGLDAISDSIDSLAEVFLDNVDDYRDLIHSAIEDTRILGEGWGIDFFLDPVHFLDNLDIDDAVFLDAKNDVVSNYDSAVINVASLDSDPACGLSLYIPRRKVDYDRNFRDNAVTNSYSDMEFAKDTIWDDFLQVFLELDENTPPEVPSITGPTSGAPETLYEFSITGNDAEDDELFVFVDWGDGTNTNWFGPFYSGEQINVEHNWTVKGTYSIRVKVKDCDESDWSDPLEISMPKTKYILCSSFIQFLQNHPNIFPLIRQML